MKNMFPTNISLDNIVGFDQFENVLCCCQHNLPHDEY
jgi:hypothetical protein